MSLFVNLQSLSCINSGAAHAIPVFYLVDGHAVFACDGRQGFSAAYFVIGYFSLWGTFPFAAARCAAGVCNGYGPAVFEQFCAAVGIDRVLAVNKSTDIVYRQAECTGFAVTRNDISFVLGVQAFDFIYVDAADIGYLLKMQVTVHLYGVCRVRNIGFHGTDVVFAVVSHYVVGGNEGGYVSSCFFGQIIIDFPIVRFAACTSNGFVDCSRAAVVGGNHQVPVLVDGIHVFEITCSGPGSFNRVAAFVHQAVAFQSVYFACIKHELP